MENMHKVEERTNLSSSVPGGTIEVSMLIFLLDLSEEVPARGAIGNMVAGQTTFVFTRVELPNNMSLPILYVPNQRPRDSFGREALGTLVAGIDGKLPGFNADFIESEGFKARVAPDSEVGGVSVFTDHGTSLALIIELRRDGEILLRSAANDPKHPRHGILEHGRTTTLGVGHSHELGRRVLRSCTRVDFVRRGKCDKDEAHRDQRRFLQSQAGP